MRFSKAGIVTAAFLLCWSFTAGTSRLPIEVEKDVSMETRDGVLLRADIYRPALEGRFPVLLNRTPYDKNKRGSVSLHSHYAPQGVSSVAVRLAGQGYVVIIQDVRGIHSSEGSFYPFLHESQDGYDAVEWAASLPYSNGQVALWGASYTGATEWLAALSRPPHLVALFAGITASDYYKGWVYRGGAFELCFINSWITGNFVPHILARHAVRNRPDYWMEWIPLSGSPLVNLPSLSTAAPYYQDWLEHENYSEYWSRWSIRENYANLKIPGYHYGGWYDIFLDGTLENFSQLKKLHPQVPQYLTVGPWGHFPIGPPISKCGELDFGPEAAFDPDAELMAWADYIVKGMDNALSWRAPVKIFVMGENVWREEQEWPLKRTRWTNYYLHSQGSANTLSGDGLLSTQLAVRPDSDRFLYDPAHPVPTRGGPLCCRLPLGPLDQREVESRDDILVYTTAPLEEPLEVTGPVQVVVHVSSDAPDTDFTAKLVDVYPDGRSYNLTDGILRMRYREGFETPASALRPGAVYRIEITTGATSNLFRKGHRVRLEISSSNFPRFDRNLNTGERIASASRMQKARNQVYHGSAHPSALVLPVIPR